MLARVSSDTFSGSIDTAQSAQAMHLPMHLQPIPGRCMQAGLAAEVLQTSLISSTRPCTTDRISGTRHHDKLAPGYASTLEQRCPADSKVPRLHDHNTSRGPGGPPTLVTQAHALSRSACLSQNTMEDSGVPQLQARLTAQVDIKGRTCAP